MVIVKSHYTNNNFTSFKQDSVENKKNALATCETSSIFLREDGKKCFILISTFSWNLKKVPKGWEKIHIYLKASYSVEFYNFNLSWKWNK